MSIAFCAYLNSISNRVSSDHMSHILCLWYKVTAEVDKLPVALLSEDDGEMFLQLSWTMNQKHLSLDIYETSSYWFFRDRVLDYSRGNSQDQDFLSVEFVKSLQIVCGVL